MRNLIKAEFLKLKGIPYFKSLLAIAIILPLVGTIINANSLKQYSWESFINQNLWLSMMLVWPIYLLIVGSIMFICEKSQRTIENLLVIPVGRKQLILAKISVLIILTMLLASITYLANLLGLTLGFSVNPNDFLSGFFHYLIGSLIMFGALLLVFALIHLFDLGYPGAFVAGCLFLIMSFVGMWNPFSASLLPAVIALRFAGCDYQITYTFSYHWSLVFYTLNICVYLFILLIFGYRPGLIKSRKTIYDKKSGL
ncbi:ABC transporter permease [Eubacteriaceae bacterium ES2]|nr:ABC transporter permease [Eubacteriaceae bacterium ES2]